MTGLERSDLADLRQRLYGGPADGEEGDIVGLKRDVASIKRDVAYAAGAVKAAAAIMGVFGLTGIVALLRGLGL